MIKLSRMLGYLLVLSVMLNIAAGAGRVMAAPQPPNAGAPVELEQALQVSLHRMQGVMAFSAFDVKIDSVHYSPQGDVALLWLAMVERETGQTLAAEPGLAIGQLTPAGWQITLQADDAWSKQFAALPEEMVNDDLRQRFAEAPADVTAGDVYTGYLLPWGGGRQTRISGSIAHFLGYNSCSEASCRYAYDFADGTMFPLVAAKSGTVWLWNTTCPNGYTSCYNFLILRDMTTTPVTYQLYLHMAYNSLPASLRVKGAQVAQGQFIGNTDDTGYSTGHHLHFHVHTNPSSYWGNSVDIRFEDVDINGGVPRACYEVDQWPTYDPAHNQCHRGSSSASWDDDWFTSGNRLAEPPTGVITRPWEGTQINSASLLIQGYGMNNLGVIGMQPTFYYDGAWHNAGPVLTANPFTTELDVCAAGLPVGPVTLGMWVYDVEGYTSTVPQGVTPLLMNYNCQAVKPPVCTPGPDQAALYASPDYQGACTVFNIGKTEALGAVGASNAESVQVGANVQLNTYNGSYNPNPAPGELELTGRLETFFANDPGLGDNPMGLNRISAVSVQPRQKPAALRLQTPANRLSTALTAADSFTLWWEGGDGAVDYRAVLTLPDTSQRTLPWQTASSWPVGSLPAGTYFWQVTARNANNETTSSLATFTIAAGSVPSATAQPLPYLINFESTDAGGWSGNGLWHRASQAKGSTANQAWVFNDGADYADSAVRAGDFTSPPIGLPDLAAGGASYLRFAYYAQTESPGPFWDQRWVQISVNGAPFSNLYQMKDDTTKEWLNSPAISLKDYAGTMIRLRFHFDIVDVYNNGGLMGWAVDDISVNQSAPDMSCAETVSDDTPAAAVVLSPNTSANGAICPAGDVDFYRFSATAGQRIWVTVDATGSPAMDPYLFLLDSDGRSVIAENDDEVYAVQRNPRLGYNLLRTGTYYLKVMPFKHPGAGGASSTYRIALTFDDQPPTVSITNPSGAWLPGSTFTFSAQAADTGSGLSAVNFYWHTADWLNSDWMLLGSDINGSNGWSVSVNPTGLGTIPGGALLVQAVDKAGLRSNAAWWAVKSDAVTPSSQLNPLPATWESTALPLQWTAADSVGVIDHFDFEMNPGSAWSGIGLKPGGDLRQAYWLASPGSTVQMRMRAVDQAGNVEAFPASAEATTQVAAVCTPDTFDSPPTGDNAPVTAHLLANGEEHNLCPALDVDWVIVPLTGEDTLLRITSVAGGAAVKAVLYDAAGITLLQEASAIGLGSPTEMKISGLPAGEYQLKLTPLVDGLWGTAARYTVQALPGNWLYLPLMLRQ